MTEEKQEKKTGEALKTMLKYVLGLVLILLGVWAIVQWLPDLLSLIKGCIGPFLILAGIIAIAIAKE